MSRVEGKLRKLTTDCHNCRFGFHCGRCFCCMPEEELQALVQEARKTERKRGRR